MLTSTQPAMLASGPMYSYSYTSDRSAFTQHDRELFAAPFRDGARARAGSALYRHFIVPLFPL